jgi:acyl-CoA thioesterase-2
MTAADAPPTASQLLELEQVSELRFRSCYNQDNYIGSIFGGQPLGQALAAAQRTVDGWPAHSLTGYYLRRGDVALPVDYDVEIVRDGRSFAQRRVLASQNGRAIFDMLCSYHQPEEGMEHQFGDPIDVPPPEELVDVRTFVADHRDQLPPIVVKGHDRHYPIELRLADPQKVFFSSEDSRQRDYWFRMPSAASVKDPRDHHCLLAFMSDYWFAATAGSKQVTKSAKSKMTFATLNHSLWIHAPTRVDEWLLYRTESPWGGDGRGLARGLIYDRDGRLVATAVQEVVMRQG